MRWSGYLTLCQELDEREQVTKLNSYLKGEVDFYDGLLDWRKLHKKQHVSAFFGKSVLKCHLT